MNTENATLQTPEIESVSPTRIQPPPPTNGLLRRHMAIHIHHFRHPVVVTYNECLRNYAAPNGGHVIDGCGEFLRPPNSNLSNPQSLHCDVCGCHRNFHRRDEEYYFTQPLMSRNRHVHIARHTQDISDESPLPILSSIPHMLMELSHDVGESTEEVPVNPNMKNVGVSRKRFRTKFTHDQKGKMLELAEKVGWKMQKRNDVVINESCREIGVAKEVFKVWMYNNKKSIVGKKKASDNSIVDVANPTIIVTSDLENVVGLSEGNFGNSDVLSGSNSGNGVGVCSGEGDLENGDGVHVKEKGSEQQDDVVGTNNGSSPSTTA